MVISPALQRGESEHLNRQSRRDDALSWFRLHRVGCILLLSGRVAVPGRDIGMNGSSVPYNFVCFLLGGVIVYAFRPFLGSYSAKKGETHEHLQRPKRSRHLRMRPRKSFKLPVKRLTS